MSKLGFNMIMVREHFERKYMKEDHQKAMNQSQLMKLKAHLFHNLSNSRSDLDAEDKIKVDLCNHEIT